MSRLAKCYADIVINFSTAVLNTIKDALDEMQERTFGDDIQIKLDALCAIEQERLEAQARLQNLINKITTAITNADIALANKFCPDLRALSDCMKDYRTALEEERDELLVGELQARILILGGRKEKVDRCGFAAAKFRRAIKNEGV